MDTNCVRCNHPNHPDRLHCFGCGRPTGNPLPKTAVLKKPKKRRPRMKKTGPHHRDNDPIAS